MSYPPLVTSQTASCSHCNSSHHPHSHAQTTPDNPDQASTLGPPCPLQAPPAQQPAAPSQPALQAYPCRDRAYPPPSLSVLADLETCWRCRTSAASVLTAQLSLLASQPRL